MAGSAFSSPMISSSSASLVVKGRSWALETMPASSQERRLLRT
jgi:hypothetical protein